jgi:hypothetical protein
MLLKPECNELSRKICSDQLHVNLVQTVNLVSDTLFHNEIMENKIDVNVCEYNLKDIL